MLLAQCTLWTPLLPSTNLRTFCAFRVACLKPGVNLPVSPALLAVNVCVNWSYISLVELSVQHHGAARRDSQHLQRWEKQHCTAKKSDPTYDLSGGLLLGCVYRWVCMWACVCVCVCDSSTDTVHWCVYTLQPRKKVRETLTLHSCLWENVKMNRTSHDQRSRGVTALHLVKVKTVHLCRNVYI